MKRDTGRRSVYRAEDAAFEGTVLVTAPGTEVLARALAALFGSSWWRSHAAAAPAVIFLPGRNDGCVRTVVDGDVAVGPRQLRLGSEAPWHVASHEIAHLVAGDGTQAHGPAFRAGHVAVAAAVFGTDCAAALADSYSQFGFHGSDRDRHSAPPSLAPIWEAFIDWSVTSGGWRGVRRAAQRSDSSVA